MMFARKARSASTNRSVLLDSNLLLLLAIGTFQRTLISRFKRTAAYTEADFDRLLSVLARCHTLVTTPHLLTEVNGLSNSLPEHLRFSFFDHFARLTQTFNEVCYPATEIMAGPVFRRFGLADSALHQASEGVLILTDDVRLAVYLRKLNRNVLTLHELFS